MVLAMPRPRAPNPNDRNSLLYFSCARTQRVKASKASIMRMLRFIPDDVFG